MPWRWFTPDAQAERNPDESQTLTCADIAAPSDACCFAIRNTREDQSPHTSGFVTVNGIKLHEGRLGCEGGAGPGREGRNMDHLFLRIDPFDVESINGHLRRNGVEPGEVSSRYGAEGEGPSIYIEDPEGNTVELKGAPWKL